MRLAQHPFNTQLLHRHARRLSINSSDALRDVSWFLELNIAAKDGNWRGAIQLIRQLRNEELSVRGDIASPTPPQNGLMLSARHYTAAISACARCPVHDGGPKWRESLGLLDEMRREGTVPTTAAYNAAMDALGRARRWQEALGLLVEMRQHMSDDHGYGHAVTMSEKSQGPQPCFDITSFNTAMKACAIGGSPREALSLFEAMRTAAASESEPPSSPPPSSSSQHYRRGLSSRRDNAHNSSSSGDGGTRGGVRASHRQGGGSTVSGRTRGGLLSAPAADLVSWNTAITACAHAGWYEKALELLDDLRFSHHKRKRNIRGAGVGGGGGIGSFPEGWSTDLHLITSMSSRSAVLRQQQQQHHSSHRRQQEQQQQQAGLPPTPPPFNDLSDHRQAAPTPSSSPSSYRFTSYPSTSPLSFLFWERAWLASSFGNNRASTMTAGAATATTAAMRVSRTPSVITSSLTHHGIGDIGDDLRPDVTTYNAVLHALLSGLQGARMGGARRKQALKVLARFKSDGVRPNLVTLNRAALALLPNTLLLPLPNTAPTPNTTSNSNSSRKTSDNGKYGASSSSESVLLDFLGDDDDDDNNQRSKHLPPPSSSSSFPLLGPHHQWWGLGGLSGSHDGEQEQELMWNEAVALYDEGISEELFSLHVTEFTTTAAPAIVGGGSVKRTVLLLGRHSTPLAQVAVATFLRRLLHSADGETTPARSTDARLWHGELVVSLDDLDPVAVDDRQHRLALKASSHNIPPTDDVCPLSIEKAKQVHEFLIKVISPPLAGDIAILDSAPLLSSTHATLSHDSSSSGVLLGSEGGDGSGSVALVLSESSIRSWLAAIVETSRKAQNSGPGTLFSS